MNRACIFQKTCSLAWFTSRLPTLQLRHATNHVVKIPEGHPVSRNQLPTGPRTSAKFSHCMRLFMQIVPRCNLHKKLLYSAPSRVATPKRLEELQTNHSATTCKSFWVNSAPLDLCWSCSGTALGGTGQQMQPSSRMLLSTAGSWVQDKGGRPFRDLRRGLMATVQLSNSAPPRIAFFTGLAFGKFTQGHGHFLVPRTTMTVMHRFVLFFEHGVELTRFFFKCQIIKKESFIKYSHRKSDFPSFPSWVVTIDAI